MRRVIPFLLALLCPLPCIAGPWHARPGRPRSIPHTHARAGFPLCLAPHQEPSRTPTGLGYYVGGGLPHGGDARCGNEGTWGYDDTGARFLPRVVNLGWGHGRRYQGGAGAYETEVGEGR